MGDSKRSKVFSTYIHSRFPNCRKILEVAGGKGEVSRELSKLSHEVTLIDKKSDKRKNSNVTCLREIFSENFRRMNVNLIIGMHPDEATSEIILYAVKYNLPFIVVPCCIVGRYSNKATNFQSWIRVLKSLTKNKYDIDEIYLKIRGKNLMLVGKPKH